MYKVIKGAFLKKGYSGMLTKLNLKKDRLKDISDALDSADLNNVNFVLSLKIIMIQIFRIIWLTGKNGVLI